MLALIVVLLSRLLIPLLILKRPLLGSILATVADNVDILIFNVLGDGISGNAYNMLDKGLDMFTLSLMAWVIFKETNLKVRLVGLWLFWYRLVGFVIYEILQDRLILFVFPNIFEFFAIAWFALKAAGKDELMNNRNFVIFVLIVCTILKLWQEYALHIVQFGFYGVAVRILGI